ncbi:MAG: hypothetical protein JO362_21605 [Streptomycetaceae bacterium]|nr:hypothetical protein [Streptomycetaceae bacterium]
MPIQDDLTAIQRRLDDLMRSLGTLENHVGHGLDMRRVRTDAEHLRDSLSLLRETAREERADRPSPEMVPIPDAPYDPSLWKDAEDEGLGFQGRHAP